MKIAITSSGLGHINRGIETWSKDIAHSLEGKGIDVALYKGGGKKDSEIERVIPCIKRDSTTAKFLKKVMPPFAWRFGFGSKYQMEATTFALSLIPELMIKKYDIIHTQDPDVANILRIVKKLGLIKSKVVLAHGTEEPFSFLHRFSYVQHLAPYHLKETRKSVGNKGRHFAIPNFVDTENFRPNHEAGVRHELGIPNDAFVILSVAAIKKIHKRIDYLVNEISLLGNEKIYLIIAGSTTDESLGLMEMGRKKLGDRIIFLTDFSHEKINKIYSVADLFTLCSLKEMMPIALLEALSSGLPCICHNYPVLGWMIGDSGECIDMSKEGKLARVVEKYFDNNYKTEKGKKAREQALNNFSKDVVVDKIINMYEEVLECSH
ncbi:MAG: glycosyltransferase family 4 protein [Planctomycetota bacterium]|jgi:glycosyltransferase involved in cell wall biosynthesis